MLIVDYKLGVMQKIYLDSLLFGENNKVKEIEKEVIGELKKLVDLLNFFGFTTNITGFLSERDVFEVKEYFNRYNYFNPVLIKDEENINITLDIQGVKTKIEKEKRVREKEKKDLVNLYYSLLKKRKNCYFVFRKNSAFNELQTKLLTLATEGGKEIFILEESGYLLKNDQLICKVLHTDLNTIKNSYNINITTDEDVKIVMNGLLERGIELIIISGKSKIYISNGKFYLKMDNEFKGDKMPFIPGLIIGKTRDYDIIKRIKLAFEINKLYNEDRIKEIETFAELDENLEEISLIEF